MVWIGLSYLLLASEGLYFLFGQLRVVRAFRSTLADLEDKRSIHSFQSLHSLRSSRSHQGPRMAEDLIQGDRLAASFYTNRAMVMAEPNGKMSKSRSAENIWLLASTDTTPAVIVEEPMCSLTPRTLSSCQLLMGGSSNTQETDI